MLGPSDLASLVTLVIKEDADGLSPGDIVGGIQDSDVRLARRKFVWEI